MAGPNDPTRVLVICLSAAAPLDRILADMSFQEIDMKHNKVIAAIAATGAFFAMNAAHAIAPAVAAGIGILGGAAAGHAAAQATPPAVAVVPPPASVAVVPDNTVVMGAPPATVEVVPAPREGYRWMRGHYEVQSGASVWVPGHWIANDVVIYQSN